MNIAEYLMSLVSRDGYSAQQFSQNLESFDSFYQQNPPALYPSGDRETLSLERIAQVDWTRRFWLVGKRTLWEESRHPRRLRLKAAQTVIIAVLTILVFGRLGTGVESVRNRSGVLFFLLSNSMFNSMQASLSVYVQDRPLYLHERLSQVYSTSLYCWARALALLPLEVGYASIAPAICYYANGLQPQWSRFFCLLGINAACYWASSAFGLLISTSVASVDLAMVIVPLVLVPFMLLSGYFIGLSEVSWVFLPLEVVNPYRFGAQAVMLNEYENNSLIPPQFNPVWPGNKQQFYPTSVTLNVLALLVIGLTVRLIAQLALWRISTPYPPRFRT